MGEEVTISIALLRYCGQASMGPSGVADQSNDWMRFFISLGDAGMERVKGGLLILAGWHGAAFAFS